MTSPVQAEQIETFEADGAVVLRKALDPAQLDVLDRGIDRNIRQPGRHFVDFTAGGSASQGSAGRGSTGRCVKDYWNWHNIPEYQDFFYGSPLAGITGQLMRAREICFLEDQFFEKSAGATTPSPWHHDQPYYEVKGRFCITWIPLDDVSEESCLEIVAGSHRWGQLYTPPNFSEKGSGSYFVDAEKSPLQPVPDIEANREQHRILRWQLQRGDVLVFSPLALHGNRGNPSAHRARRATFRWAAEGACYDQGVFPWATLIDGHGLTNSQRLLGERFPLLWTRDDGLLGRERSAELMRQYAHRSP